MNSNIILSALAIAWAEVLSCTPNSTAATAVFDVNVRSPQLTLYTDPYNGNEIKVGGFSGLYPVPGQSDTFYVITDRVPAPDFTDASGHAFKTVATPNFGPHILTVRLMPNNTAKIEEIQPLKRPGGGSAYSASSAVKKKSRL